MEKQKWIQWNSCVRISFGPFLSCGAVEQNSWRWKLRLSARTEHPVTLQQLKWINIFVKYRRMILEHRNTLTAEALDEGIVSLYYFSCTVKHTSPGRTTQASDAISQRITTWSPRWTCSRRQFWSRGGCVPQTYFFLCQASQTEVDRAVAVSEGAGQHHNQQLLLPFQGKFPVKILKFSEFFLSSQSRKDLSSLWKPAVQHLDIEMLLIGMIRENWAVIIWGQWTEPVLSTDSSCLFCGRT